MLSSTKLRYFRWSPAKSIDSIQWSTKHWPISPFIQSFNLFLGRSYPNSSYDHPSLHWILCHSCIMSCPSWKIRLNNTTKIELSSNVSKLMTKCLLFHTCTSTTKFDAMILHKYPFSKTCNSFSIHFSKDASHPYNTWMLFCHLMKLLYS